MKSIIIHHHDLDGFTAGSVALLAFPGSDSVSLNYEASAKIPTVEDLAEYERVVVVDYTLPPETMKALNEAGKLLWIDHHVSSIRKSVEWGYDGAPGLRSGEGCEKLCGAELAWRFFQGGEIPRFLQLVGEFDTFRNSHAPEFREVVMPFFYGSQLAMERMRPANSGNPDFLLKSAADFLGDGLCDDFIAKGKLIREYNLVYYEGLMRESSFVRNLWGLRVLCFNCAGHGSLNMQPFFDPEQHDAMLLYSYDGSGWSYGIYTDSVTKGHVNLSEIAVSYGGGGHRSAAGFHTRELLPELQ